MTSLAPKRDPRARAAMYAVFAVFFAAGLTFSSWASRIPTVQSQLDLTPGEMGLLLLVGSLGSIISLPTAGRIVGRFGPRRTLLVAVFIVGIALAAAVAAVPAGRPVATAVLLMISLAAVGTMDIAMNFEGTLVEQRLERSIMPYFHGGFSLGTIAGAGIGVLASRASVPITTHVWLAAIVAVAMVLVALRFFFPDPARPADSGYSSDRGAPSYGKVWLEPRTLMIGVIVLSAALTEGAANDWLALGVREGFDVPEHQGAFGLTLFMTAMTVMRFAGTALLNRFGRVAVLRLCTGLAIIGLAIFGLAPTMPLALFGAVLWGLGSALGFPVGMSAASDEPLLAAARLSVVATIGYGAFLLGPPLLGFLANGLGYRHALLVLIVPLIASLALTRQAAPPTASKVAT